MRVVSNNDNSSGTSIGIATSITIAISIIMACSIATMITTVRSYHRERLSFAYRRTAHQFRCEVQARSSSFGHRLSTSRLPLDWQRAMDDGRRCGSVR
jgi:hypothetical protein